ncbi:type II toxin-antitoxin system HicA family toxin [Granulicella tundricola]|uniref:YcfA family protein n=1 Tax=Granulicella tundricola (strain ATCC BAA-1859 / DSM 23138 / MP5ACTX9) TaxID=1198114 RepID=E8WVJ5_GRATM|nr:hypothetical protein AciX9_1384 [Granulicella tundricola MP5ACTX9]
MKTPRNLHGSKLVDHLVRCWGYRRAHQTGSHIHLRTDFPTGQTVIIPDHRPLKVGTLNSILDQVAYHRGVPRQDILRDL